MNPTNLPIHIFVDNIPLVRALAFGVGDGYPRGHYPAMEQTATDHPLFGARKTPHDVFLHPRYSATAAHETARQKQETPTEHFARDAEHRAAALEAISPDVAASFSALSASDAESAGLCPAHLWEDQQIPAVEAVAQTLRRSVPKVDEEGAQGPSRGGPVLEQRPVVEVLRPAIPPGVRLGVRSQLAARAAAAHAPTPAADGATDS
jgi:hypothetical protein